MYIFQIILAALAQICLCRNLVNVYIQLRMGNNDTYIYFGGSQAILMLYLYHGRSGPTHSITETTVRNIWWFGFE